MKTSTATREYVLDPNLRYSARRPVHNGAKNAKDESSESPIAGQEPISPEREAPGQIGAGLSQRHSLTAPSPPLMVPDCSRQRAQVEIWRGGTLIRIQRDAVRENQKIAPKRGSVLNFSAQSRRNMLTLLNQMQKVALPLFITLTMPGGVKIEAEQLNRAFHSLRMAATRTFLGCAAVWKKELQDRKSGEFKGEFLPHFHLLGWGFPELKFPFRRYAGKWVSVTKENGCWIERIWAVVRGEKVLHTENRFDLGAVDRFGEWLSRMWYEFIGSGEFKHYQAGTSFEQIKFAQGVKRYAAKYLGKEQAGAGNPFALGRYWGVWQKQKLPWAERLVYQCTDKQAVKLMRVARKYFEMKTGRKSRLGHSVVKLFVNDSSQWERLVCSVLDG